MLKIKIDFNNNRGSFALDAIAQTLQGNWDSRSSTETSGIVTGVDSDSREWAEELLDNDERVESYTISEE